MTIKEIKKGTFFRLKENGKVYVRGEYERSLRKYEYYDFYDVNNYHYAKGNKPVITDFEF